MRRSSTFLERVLRNAKAKDLGQLCFAARPQRSTCSTSFCALTIYIPRLFCLCQWKKYTRPASATPVVTTADSKRNLRLAPDARHILLSARVWPFSNLLRRPFHKTLRDPARVWPVKDLLHRPASRVLFFGRLQHCPFGRLEHESIVRIYSFSNFHVAPSDNFNAVWPSRDFCHNLYVFYSWVCHVPTVLSRHSVLGAYCFPVSL